MSGTAFTTVLFDPEDLPESITAGLKKAPDRVFGCEQKIYLAMNDKILCMPDDPSGRQFVYCLKQQGDSPKKPQSLAEIYGRILKDEQYQPDPAQARRFGIGPGRRMCVTVFRAAFPLETDLASLVSDMAPTEERDGVVPVDYRTAALIRDMEEQTEEEMIEYAEAVTGTMESEGIAGIRAGIGGAADHPADLRRSFREALQALSLGLRYHPQDHVYASGRQTLEMIVDAIPPEQRPALRRLVFGEDGKQRLSDEMLDTVRVFFENDLNLTAASKQLFIHRNTLNYRLDKIKKDFGVDLRSFRDAVIFKIVSEMTDKP